MTARRTVTLHAHCEACLDLAERLLRDLGLLELAGGSPGEPVADESPAPAAVDAHDVATLTDAAGVSEFTFRRALAAHVVRITLSSPGRAA